MNVALVGRSKQERWSIGQVLERLNSDFADLTLSKLRFLEERGLVTPERTTSGYRKFSQGHIDRLRLVLTLQRDHYLPLKVISDYLQDLEDGKSPDIPGITGRQPSILRSAKILNRDEMLRLTGASLKLFSESVAAGLLPAVEVFPQDSVEFLGALVELERRGITPRHLRSVRLSVDRDADLLTQAATARSRSDQKLNVREEALEMARHMETVRAGVLRNRLSS